MPINRKELIKQIAPELIALVLLVPLIIIIGAVATRLPIFQAEKNAEEEAIVAQQPISPSANDANQLNNQEGIQPSQSETQSPNDDVINSTVELFIISPQETSRYNISIQEQITVIELLKQAGTQGLELTTKDYGGSLGIFIESLGGIKNDPDQQLYWQLYINNELSPVGASAATAKAGDNVTWKLEPPHIN